MAAGSLAAKTAAAPLGGGTRRGEYGLAGGGGEGGKIVGDRLAARLASLPGKAEVPILVVQHPGSHVDHHRAFEPCRRRARQHPPQHRRAERPADPDCSVQLKVPGKAGHVLGEDCDGGPNRAGG